MAIETPIQTKTKNIIYYSLFKNEIKTEAYAILNVSKYKRSVFFQLQIGVLPPKIELRRYYRKKLDERVCQLCNRAIENEIHLLCVCPIYTNIRLEYYYKLNVSKSQGILEDFQSIVCHENNTNVLINFVYDLWKYRNDLLCKL